MLTKIIIRNFKNFEDVSIDLSNGVVFIGPNNFGKTSALQALSLWYAGLQKWAEKHAPKDVSEIPTKRPGVTVSRLELISLPVSAMDLIWHDRKVRSAPSKNIRIDLIVEGISNGKFWECGLEFDYSNPDALFCRPLRDNSLEGRMKVPPEALKVKLAFLPSMSGLASEEALIQEGRINVLIGQGQTAEVLRNLCYRVYEKEKKEEWNKLIADIQTFFGITINAPAYSQSRGTVVMNYQRMDSKIKLDLPSSGRGMQQVLLLLAYLYDNDPGTVLLLDEPDAHLEILRQREIYNLLIKVAESRNAQIVAASHSEILLNVAAQRGTVISFVGKPHLLARGRTSEVRKALSEIGYDQYYHAENEGWVLYLEGESDLSILKEFAIILDHPAKSYLQTPFVKYLGNDRPNEASKSFHALREAKDDLVGVLLMDRLKHGNMKDEGRLKKIMWRKREIENYLCNRKAIISFVVEGIRDDIFGRVEKDKKIKIMEGEIENLEEARRTLDKPSGFHKDIKASDKFLTPLFRNFSKKIMPSIPKESLQILRKKDFFLLVKHIPIDEIDPEVKEKLDAIVEVAQAANPKKVR